VFSVVFLVLSVTSFLFFKCLESDAFGSTPVAKALTEVKAVAEPKSEQCSHGIKSPNTDCPECIAFFAAERLAGLERAEIAAKAKKMRFDSLALAQKEFTRLRTEWVQNADSFFKMTWQQFEDEIAVCFSKLGYHVKQTKRTGDGGFDGKITKDGQTLLYECKSGKQNIGRRPIQIFHSAITTEQADGGIYINTGTFLKTAIEYAGRAKVTLIDGTSLVAFLNRAYPARNKALPLSMMCTTCAEVFTVEGLPVTATCSNGHEVKNQITEESLATGNRTYDSERHIWETHYRNPWGWQKIRQTPRVLEPDAVVPQTGEISAEDKAKNSSILKQMA
jgi:HJR/Mrr/RecB family endonuclease